MATYTVTTNLDEDFGASLAADKADGDGLSLREAIHWANQTTTADTVDFDASLGGTTLVLTQGKLVISEDLTVDGDIDGNDSADITISGNNASRIFDITGTTTVALDSLTLTNGNSTGAGGGGAIRVYSGVTLTLSDSTVSNSTVGTGYGGGGISNYGTTTVVDSVITGNQANIGGGIANAHSFAAALTVVNSTISDNLAATYGGGVYVADGTATVQGTTVHGNTANQFGGGIAAGMPGSGGTVTLENSTITGNTANNLGGGGLDLYNGSAATVTNTVIAENTNSAGNNDVSEAGTDSTINATNSFFGTAVTLDSDTGGASTTDGGDPGLGALQDNGGKVPTRLVLTGSDLIDAGDNGSIPGALTTDANGNDRNTGEAVDIGATEFQLVVTTTSDNATNAADDSLATDLADGGGLSLREAIHWASAGDEITFDAALKGSTITLGSELAINKNLTIDGDIDGDDAADITLSGDANGDGISNSGDNRVFNIGNSATVNLASLTLDGGYSASGGLVRTATGTTLAVSDTSFLNGATADVGGAISSGGTLTVENSLFLDNSANFGGAVFVDTSQSATFTQVTMTGNHADLDGGAIDTNSGATVTLYNSTITGNSAGSDGGGIDAFSGSTLTLVSTVVAGNTAVDSGPDLSETSSPSTIGASNSFLGTQAQIDGIVDAGSGLQFGDDPDLGALANNGGTVMTHAVLADSPLIDNGSNPQGLAEDANGNDRTSGTTDIGATEFQITVTTASDTGDNGVGASLIDDIADGGGLSLREAIAWAADGDTITFDASLKGSTIRLGGSELTLLKDLTIDGDVDGDGKADITISGDTNNNGVADAGDSAIFVIDDGASVTLRSLTLTDGRGGDGGAIYATGNTTLALHDTTVQNSVATDDGGGIYTLGDLTIVNSTISGNTAQDNGGGIIARGALTVINSTIYGNTGTDNIGGIGFYGDSGDGDTLTIRNSTISGNTVTNADAVLDLGFAAGIRLYSGARATITNSIIAGNSSAYEADLSRYGPMTIALGNTFIGTALDGGFGAFNDLGGNTFAGGDPKLGELLDNGGTVLTLSPLDGSPVIGMGSATLVRADTGDIDGDGITTELLPQDGRGGTRQVGTLDAGAVEKITNERITGTAGANTILGGTGNDTLSGLDGNDTLDGGLGLDVMKGGKGNDTYIVDRAGDTVSEAGGSGKDLVKASVNFTLGNGLENLILTGRGNIKGIGNTASNDITGNAGKNFLDGKGGNDTIDGGAGNDTINGGTGKDVMKGGGGNDLFLVDNVGDKVVGGSSHDTVKSSVKFALGADVEDLILTGNANLAGTGNNGRNEITGNRANNELHGKGGNDTLLGGAGNDKLFGEAGNDLLNGGGGKKDMAVYSGKLAKFDFKELSGGRVKVIDHSGANGTDILTGIELIKIGGHVYDLTDLLA